jgi:hypothetical protein
MTGTTAAARLAERRTRARGTEAKLFIPKIVHASAADGAGATGTGHVLGARLIPITACDCSKGQSGTKSKTLMQDATRRSDDDDELLTTDESAEFLDLSKSFLAKARRKGTGPPFIEIGDRLIKYKKSSLRKWRDDRQFLQSRRRRK